MYKEVYSAVIISLTFASGHVHDVNEEWFRVLEINAQRKSKTASMKSAEESLIHGSDRLHCFFQSE